MKKKKNIVDACADVTNWIENDLMEYHDYDCLLYVPSHPPKALKMAYELAARSLEAILSARDDVREIDGQIDLDALKAAYNQLCSALDRLSEK